MILHSTLLSTLSNFTPEEKKNFPLDVLPLYKNVSNRQECEGLQGDLKKPQGGLAV